MTAICLKEIRENFKWAAGIFGVYGVILFFQIRGANPTFLFDIARPNGPTLITIAIFGTLMGVAQSVFDLRHDNWAFAVHRPISRSTVFAGKCLVGLALLFVSLAGPCVAAVAWAVKPGNLAIPFQWRMALPLAANVLVVGPFYFAAMVVTLRKARWFGSRLLPMGLAGGSALAVIFAPHLWQAASFTLLAMAIGALAAWNVFATAGISDRGGAPRVALGTMIYAGALGIGCFLVVSLSVFQTTTVWHSQRVDRDGNLLRIRYTIDNNVRTCLVSDANGRAVPEFQGIDLDDRADVVPDRFVRFSNGLIDERQVSAPWPIEAEAFGYRTITPGVIGLRAVASPGKHWRRLCYFDVLQRVIDVYDPVTRRLLGTVGPAEFTEGDVAPAERFPGRPLNPLAQGGTHTLSFPSVVYWMELDQHRVRKLFTPVTNDPVVAAAEIGPQTDPTVALVTRNHLHVMQPSGAVLFSAAHELDLSKYWICTALLTSNLHVAVQARAFDWESEADHPYQLLEFDRQGTLVRRTLPPPLPDDPHPTKLRRTAMMGAVYPLGGLGLFTPWLMDNVFELETRRHATLFHGFLFGSAALASAATLLLARRCGFGVRKAIAWSLANAVLGLAGLVVMLSLNDWPAREICHSCGGKRIVGRRNCSRCGAALPAPAGDGREIFEPGDSDSINGIMGEVSNAM